MTDIMIDLFGRYTKEKIMQFQDWLQTPHGKQVYGLFRQFAYKWREAGHGKCAGSLIVNRIRWEMAVSAEWQGYKVRNEYAPMMSRQLVVDDPTFAKFFSFHGVGDDKQIESSSPDLIGR